MELMNRPRVVIIQICSCAVAALKLTHSIKIARTKPGFVKHCNQPKFKHFLKYISHIGEYFRSIPFQKKISSTSIVWGVFRVGFAPWQDICIKILKHTDLSDKVYLQCLDCNRLVPFKVLEVLIFLADRIKEHFGPKQNSCFNSTQYHPFLPQFSGYCQNFDVKIKYLTTSEFFFKRRKSERVRGVVRGGG